MIVQKREMLLQLVPNTPDWKIDWEGIENSNISLFIEKMKQTMQNPAWHGEGDVWTHTKMACEELVQNFEFRNMERRKQQELFLAMLLHDIGKIPCTKWEDEKWTSPNHTSVGSKMAREFLWKECGFCGTKELQNFRETVCNLIRYHSVPMHILEQKNPEWRLQKIMANGELAEDFSMEMLGILVESDVKGRIVATKEESLELLQLCIEMAKEAKCYQYQKLFPDSFSEYAYLSGRNIQVGQQLYNDTWGEVILLSGLPGTGKDTWIRENCSELPMISLDEIRKEMKILPTDNQGAVVQEARERAKEYLRKQIPFVWNATNLTPQIRQKQCSLFEDYHASVKIVFLETDWEEQMKRNCGRKAVVPEKVIREMLKNLVLPERFEAQEVKWHCV